MSIDDRRRAFAETLRSFASIQHPSLVDAFARVPRERFLGPGPWQMAQPFDLNSPYRWTPDAELEHVYQDAVVAIDPARRLNNGQPSAHARWIDAVAPASGESVLHLGCGTGYYTAIHAEMVGPSGHVDAIEVDPSLAERARDALSSWPQVQVRAGDGSKLDGQYDVIYINAGATHARPEWCAALKPEGRMLLPLTAHLPMVSGGHGVGFALCTVRRGERWPTRFVSPVGIFDCVGARDERAEASVRKLLAPEAAPRIRAISIEPHSQEEKCLVHVEGFCLQS
jgi:protein-L-isoaspartate(D-aspartate) O-methyltransferase